MVRDRAMRDDVGFGPLPVVSHSGVFDSSGASAGRLACVLALAGLLCVSSSQGQVIREEGFPVKGGVPEESAWAPVVREECDPFTVPGEFGESCAPREKTPDPFGFGPEGEARPGEPSGPVWRTPPRLECPVAIFLEELETGAIECYAWDASGEEHLEYSWEPVGSTTRDYLNNPRLIPEDAPNPSVVAPEAPVYEMLESFRSGGTTFLYRYRLTATSRATGLFSHEEVEVYVSGSRPSVYCPLEVAVEEGETVSLDCEGVDPLSHRMDYDEEGASILWEWEGLWGTSTLLLDATDMSSALFTAPAGSAGEEYHYIASMTSSASGMPRTARRRVSVRVVGGEAVGDTDSSAGVTCDDSPYSVYEGAEDLLLDCDGDAPLSVNVWLRWSRLGEQVAPPQDASSTPKLRHRGYDAIFYVPDLVDTDEIYEYTIAIWTAPPTPGPPYSLFASDDVRITVLNKPAIDVDCAGNPYEVDEGDPGFDLNCTASGAPASDPQYTWSWSPTARLTDHDTATPKFEAPDDVSGATTYTYTVTATADNAEDGIAEVTVTVKDTDAADPSLTCADSEVYEGAADITLDCSVTNEPTGAAYAWGRRGSTMDTNLLSGTDGYAPTFFVPDDIDEPGGANKDYEYTVRLSAPGIDDITEAVTVTVLEKPDIWCNDARFSRVTRPEGSSSFPIHICFPGWTGAPGANPVYTYAWTAQNGTPDTRLLSATNIEIPTFDTPDAVDRTTTYYYRLRVSAENADDASVWFRVKVFDKPDITVTCESPYEVDEGDADIELVCDESGGPTEFTERRWSWLPIANLTDHDTATPMFAVPDDVDRDTTYTYTVTASAGHNAHDGIAEVTVTVRDTDTYPPETPGISCIDPDPVYEGTADITLDCSVTDEPSGAAYAWAPRGSTLGTSRLSSTAIPKPTFFVPGDIDEPGEADKDYEYTVTLSAGGADVASADITVTVLEKPDIYCPGGAQIGIGLFEGSSDFPLRICEQGWTGAPGSNPVYAYAWTARGSTPDTRRLSATNIDTPIFDVPDTVEGTEAYTYTLTVSAANADDASVPFNVVVTERDKLDITVTCEDSPYEVDEGDTDTELECDASGGPDGSTYTWSWSPTTNLTDHNTATPMFAVPDDVYQDTTYTYTVTASADNADDGTAEVMVTVRDTDSADPSLTCTDSEVYEGASDFTLDCSVTDEPSGATYTWTSSDVYGSDLLSSTTILKPTFLVPADIPGVHTDDYKRIYRYTVTMSATNISDITADVTVTVLEKPNIRCGDQIQLVTIFTADEGGPDFRLNNCPNGWTRAPGANPVYMYAWTARGSTANTDLLSATNIESPTFAVPDRVESTETYTYTLTVSAENADDMSVRANVVVVDRDSTEPSLTCTDSEAYEGAADITLDCSVTDEPTGATYAWTGTDIANRLSSSTILKPTFDVPDNVDADTDYDYTVTLSASGIDDVTEDVTVTVLNKPSLTLICAPVAPVYEDAADFDLDCVASGDPSGSDNYTYVWTAQGATSNTDLLSSTTIAKPTFDVPEEVDGDETYEYLLTVSADNAEDVSANVTVRVLNKPSLTLICTPPAPVYEGAADFDLNCSASGAPSGSEYNYVWTGRGSTVVPGQLSSTTVEKPTFDVPEEVDSDETYEYTLTVSADNAESAAEEVTVTVLNKKALEVACATPSPVYEESEDFALDCAATGAPAGSEYAYVWTGRGSTTNTDLLVSGTDGPTPTFDVPEAVDEDETYEYLLTVSAENAEDATAEVTVKVLNFGSIALTCASPPLVYEGSEDFELDCSILGDTGDTDYTYEWTARGATPNTDELSATNIPSPTFYVPDALDRATTYEYLLTARAANVEDATAEVTVTVLNRGALALVCTDPGSVYEGSADIALDCAASGAPAGSEYAYVWTDRGATANTDRLISGTDGPTPTFDVPEEVDSDETYEYRLTVSAENADPASADVTVKVLNKGALSVACATPSPVYEGSEDFALDCAVSGAPGGSTYEYEWTARNGTANTDLLIAGADGPAPTFDVPEEVDEDETYEYLLTVSAENAESASAEVTVTVLNLGSIALVCASPPLVYEGSADFALDCSASGAPGGSAYEYEWTARNSTANTDLLIAGADGPAPTFDVPEEVEKDETYEYTLTVSAANAESASAEVTVTVLNLGSIALVCASPPLVYEGSADFALDCSASGAPGGSAYEYEWTARNSTANTDLLIAGADGPAPTFDVPEEVEKDETYEYTLTVSAANAESASAEVTVTVLNKEALALVCTDPGSVYEGSADIAFDCSASGAPGGSAYEYEWTARNSTANTDLLIAGADGPAPTFDVPEEVGGDETYEYRLTVSAANAESASAEVTVTVLNKGALALVCADPGSVYEGSADIAFDCEASGAPSGSAYVYSWIAQGDTPDTALLSAADIASPTFLVPDAVDEDETYEYLLTASADNAEDATAEVTVTVLNKEALALVCTDPGSVYEGSADIAFDCSASGAPGGSAYEYEWTARNSTANTDLLIAGADGPAPTFDVPEEVGGDETYEYRLTVSAANAESASAEVTVTVLNKGALALVCADPGSVYEGSADIAFDCEASGAPSGSAYVYSWIAQGDTPDTALLSAADIASPTFLVPDAVDEDETYEYLLTASADNAEDARAEVTVTVLNKEALAVVCADPGSVYEGSADIAFDCSASGAPGDDPQYTYVWTARGDTPDTSLLSAVDVSSPTFDVPDEVDEDETYEYTLTVSAVNAEDAAAEVTVTVLDRIQTPAPDPVSPPVDSPPLASSSAREPSDPSALGVTVSASSLRFGVQSSQTQVSLDPLTDGISTRVSGPYHAGRMALSPGGGASFDENGEMDLSIEVISPVLLKREDAAEPSSLVLSPSWSFAESCEQLSSQAIGGLYTEATLTEGACRLLRFGGELDLTGAPSGRYAGSLDVVLRSGEREETHSVEVEVTVVPSQRVITIGPGGVRFSTSRELAAGLTEEQNLSIYPDVAFLTEGKPHGVFELSNPSLIPLEVSVSARFGYTEATENGREVVIESPEGSRLGDLSQVVDIHPAVVVLQPGEKGLVRYGVQEGALAAMAEKGYAAFFDVVSAPRQYVRSDRMPEEVTGERTARVTMRVPGVYVPGDGASQLRATLLSISYVGSLSATFLVETGDRPFAGEVVAYDGQGRELGRRETLVYTRSRVRVPLTRMPEEEVVFLRFSPRGSGRVPDPVNIPWNAPRRDIGAAGEKEGRTTPKSALQ